MTDRYKYKLIQYDLSAALNERLELEGGFVYIKDATDSSTYVEIQFDSNTADKVKLVRKTGTIAPFRKLWITAPAQAGKTVTILVTTSYELFRVLEQSIQDVNVTNAYQFTRPYAIGGSVLNVTCTLAATEYSQSMAGYRFVSIKPRGGALQVSFAVGTSGTVYFTLADGQGFDCPPGWGGTLYFQSPAAGTVVEIIGGV